MRCLVRIDLRRSGHFLPDHRREVSRGDLFALLDYLNEEAPRDAGEFGTVTVTYREGLPGCTMRYAVGELLYGSAMELVMGFTDVGRGI